MKNNLLFSQTTALSKTLGKRLAMVLTMLLTISIGQAWGADYELVTSAPSDWSGEYLIVAGTSALSGGTSSWGTTTTVTVSNNKISTTANISVTISKGGTSGTYYIYMNSNSKYLKEVTSNTFATADASSTETEWKISLSNGNAQIACASSTTRYLRLNGSSGYRCYTSATGTLPKLYKKAASYTITAKSNNNTYGTVSLSGTTITATPKTGYRVSTATPYTISPSGSATVSQDGNTFSVTPNANCTITINFEAIPKYTVNWYINGTIEYSQTDVAGTTLTNIPNLESYECGGKVFVGWTTQSSYENATNAPNDLMINTAGLTIPENGEDFYAVFANVETIPGKNTTQWVETEIGSISSNDEIVVTMSKGTTTWVLRDDNGTTSAPYAESITISNKQITSTIADELSWIIEKDGNNLTFHKDATKKSWLYCTANNNGVRVGTNANKVFTIDASSGYLKNTATSRYLGVYMTNPDWRCYDNTTGNIADQTLAFYKKTTTTTSTETITNYTTSCTKETSVTLHPNGGSGETTTKTIKETTYTVPDCPFSRLGYTFANWNTRENGTGNSYDTDDTIDNLDGTPITLYAQWTCETPVFNIKIKEDNPVVFSGEPIELTVVGSNIAADATYQWYKYNGATYDELAGETTNKLTIAEATANDASNYKCVVTNGTCSGENNYTVKMYHIKGLTDNAWTTPFEFEKSGDKEGTFSVELAANTTYYFKLNDGSVWYWNEGTMTHNNCTDWMIEQEGADTQGKANTGITTTASGTYIFTLNYEDPSKPELSVIYPAKRIVYLEPNIWASDNPKFAVHAWGGAADEDVLMTKIDDCADRNIYFAEIDAAHTHVFFIRGDKNNYSTSNPWNNVWNRTVDLTLSNNNLFYVDNWNDANENDKSNGYWKNFTPNYSVTFDANGHGTAPEDQCIADGGKATNPGNLSTTGYTFGGWYKDADCTNAWDFAADVVTADITLYAKWTINTHTVTWKPAGGNWGGNSDDIVEEYSYGEEIKAPEKPAYDCHEFVAWDPVYTVGMTMPDDDLEFTAQWNKLSYTITFKNYDGKVLQTSTVECGKTPSYTGATPMREQTAQYTYAFSGWSPTIAPATKNQDYAAQFDEVTRSYTVTWMVGTTEYTAGTPTNQVEYDKKVTNLPTSPQDDAIGTCANTFIGWSTKSSGSNAENADYYDDLFTTAENSPAITDATTFYAVFATEEAGGGEQTAQVFATSSLGSTNTVTTGYTISAQAASKEGYYQDGSGDKRYVQVMKSDVSTSMFANTPTSVTVTAKLGGGETRNDLTNSVYAIWLDKDGNELGNAVLITDKITATTGSNFTVNLPIANATSAYGVRVYHQKESNYNVRYYAISLSYKYNNTTYSNYVTSCCETPAPRNGTFNNVTGSGNTMSLTLNWEGTASRYHITCANPIIDDHTESTSYKVSSLTECEEYTFYVSADPEDGCESEAITITAQPFSGAKTVTFNYNGNGQANTTSSTSCGNISITLPTPAWTGYRFMGWFTAESGGTEIDDNPYTPTEDITLFAHWAKEYTVTYDLQGGTASPVCSGDKYIAGEIVTICTSTPIRSGYKFTGWTYSPVVTITNGQFAMPASNVTITAEFVARAVTNIEVATNTHRVLMQGSTFVGEQIRVTYDNGETELLEWSNSKLTFVGHNTNELGVQTVTVTYTGEGTAHTQYNIEVIDGLGITFWDGDDTETIKYEPGNLVDVDNRIGQNICSGWEFAGWSETKVANESKGFTPVHNFNATDPKTLYAVYVKIRKNSSGDDEYESEDMINDLKEGARYVLAYYVNNNNVSYGYTALTPTSTGTYYLAGTHSNNSGFSCSETKNANNSYIYHSTAVIQENAHWQLIADGIGYWQLLNLSDKTYLDLSGHANNYAKVSNAPNGKIVIENAYDWVGDNNSQLYVKHSTATSDIRLSWDRNNSRFNQWDTNNGYILFLTKDEEFTSTPPCSPLSATFHGNGGIVTDGVNSGDDLTITEPTRDAGITTPTASFTDCNGKSWTFVGWSREEIDVTCVPVLTTDLLHDGGGNKHYDIQEDGEEFWAVFTNTGDPETKNGMITFTDTDVTPQYENAKTITKSVTAMGDYDFELYHVSNASNLGIQFDHNNATKGYIKNITSLGKINSISLNEFQTGDIDDVKVYVGNMPNAINTLLTEADLQQTGNTYTYYPQKNYAYVKIEANGYCGITSISIDFGKGTQIWATTPDCSTITLSGDELYVTSTNGQSIRAAERLTVKAVQLESKAKVVISSNSSDIYFSDVQDANFTQAVKPTETLTLTTDVDGNLSATEIYVHYRPSVDGTGIPEDVVVSANLETPNPGITDDQTIHVRNLPATFAIVAKVGNVWYALPSQGLNSTTPPAAYPVEVDNMADPTAVVSVPTNADWSLRQVYTSFGSDDRFADYGDNLVFVNNASPAMTLNASSSEEENYLLTDAQYNNYYSTNPGLYEWTPTTTDLKTYQLTNEQRGRTLSVNTATVFGVHAQNKAVEQVRFLPIQDRYTPAALQVVEWKENSVVIMYNGNPAQTASVSVNGGKAQETVLSSASAQRDIAVYELAATGLAANPTQRLSITIGTEKVILPIPYIISSSKNDIDVLSGSTVAARQEVAKVSDLVILKDATLTASGAKGNPYKFRNVTVYGGGKLVIPSEEKGFGVASLTLRAGGITDAGEYDYVYPQFELRGTFTNSAAKINYDYITDYDHWFHLVLPFDGDLGTIKYPTEFYGANVAANNTGSWQIKRYAGEIRATGNYNAWVDIETEDKTSTTAGQGYIFWGAPKKVSVNGGASTRQKWGIQRITMSVKADDAMTAENGDKAIQELSSHEDVANNSGAANDQGWNLVGNPYMVNLTDMATTGLHACKLVEVIDPATGKWNGKWEWNNETNIRYLTIPSDHFDTYTAKTVAQTVPLVAGRAFFVQLEGEANGITFAAANRASLMPALLAENSDKPVDIETGIILSNETLQDEVNFWIKDGKTNDYEYNADYPKTPNNTNFNIYGVHTNGDLSWVAINPILATESMPIGYQVPAAGTYMLSLSETYYSEDLESLYLTDHAMSPELTVDLINAPYEFSVNQAETNNERFTISLKLKSENQGPTTGWENIDVGKDQSIKFIHQDRLYILRNGIIYDATGQPIQTINK